MAKRCYGCMKMKEQSPLCEHCGYNENIDNLPHQLPLGTLLRGQYIIGKVLGQGGFGITYLGWDKALDMPVAIKEYYPNSVVKRECSVTRSVTAVGENGEKSFLHNRDRFLREARTLARLGSIDGIVRVYNLFEDNDTAYIVMEYVEGVDLRKFVQLSGGGIGVQKTLTILKPIMESLKQIHSVDLVHRDISPDNIMLQPDGSAKLLDFGAAREVVDADVEKEMAQSTEAILKHGFAPMEQYQKRGTLGPWTDVYALCATIYYCLTGNVPADAPARMVDELEVGWKHVPGLTEIQADALEKGMELRAKDRLASVQELYDALYGNVAARTRKIPEVDSGRKKQKRGTTPYTGSRGQTTRQTTTSRKQQTQKKQHPQPEKKKSNAGGLILVALMLVIVGGAAAYANGWLSLPGGLESYLPESMRQQEPAVTETAPPLVTPVMQETQAPVEETTAPVETEAPETLPPETEPPVVLTKMLRSDPGPGDDLAGSAQWPVFGSETLRSEIKMIRFLDTLKDAPADSWDVAAAQDGAVKAGIHLNWKDQELYIAADGGVIAPEDCTNLFAGYNKVKEIRFNNKNFDTSYVKNMKGMFAYCATVSSLNLYSFDTDKVTDMSYMFYHCDKMSSVSLDDFNTARVTDMSYMFRYCEKLQTLSLSNFNTYKVTDMRYMFADCKFLTNLNLSRFNTSKVENMSYMFAGSHAVADSLRLGHWETSSIDDYLDYVGFMDVGSYIDSSSWRLLFMRNVWDVNILMDDVLPEGAEDGKVLGSDIDRSKIVNITIQSGLAPKGAKTWDVSEAKNGSVIAWTESLGGGRYNLFIAGDGGVVAPQNSSGLFAGYSNLQNIRYHDSLGTCFHSDNVTDMSRMFENCKKLKTLDLSKMDTSTVTTMEGMFRGCSSLNQINWLGINTSQVTNMKEMFRDCDGFQFLELTALNTAKVTNMQGMFRDCDTMSNLTLSGFKTENVTDMSYMFAGCKGILALNLSSFHTGNVVTMESMFEGYGKPGGLNLGTVWEVDSVENYENFLAEGVIYRQKPWEDLFVK